jgi:opacity protein-like surface antigen
MKLHRNSYRATLAAFTALTMCCLAGSAAAQHHGGALNIQGLHQHSGHSAASAGVGGMSLLVRNDPATMFHQPANLAASATAQISVGGVNRWFERSQVQHYAPVRYYPNLSLLLEGMTHLIPEPRPDFFGFTPRDSVQRPFDDIGPNWESTNSTGAPLQAFASLPVDLGAFRIVAGAGVVEYADLDFYYQNNNVLSPNILSQRPLPVSRPTDDQPLGVDWHQVTRSRSGTLGGYGGALAMNWHRHNLALGISGVYVSGTSDDLEYDLARGRLVFFSNAFRLDSLNGQVTRKGRSAYSGFDLALGTTLSGEHVRAGITVRPPMTLTRSFTPDGAPAALDGEDRLTLPWRGTLGIALAPRSNLTLGLEYEFRPFARATHEAGGHEETPWMSASVFRVGGEFAAAPFLALRGGMRRGAEPFGADGRPIESTPVTYMAYSAGAGLSFAGAQLNVAFETRNISYEDLFGSAVHYNRDRRQTVVADLIYTFGRRR